MKWAINQKIQKFGIGNPKFCGILQQEILMIAESSDNQMNDSEISANWRVSNLRISVNSWTFITHILLPTLAWSSLHWWLPISQFYEIPWLFGQFSNSVTFPGSPGFPGSLASLLLLHSCQHLKFKNRKIPPPPPCRNE